MRGGALSEAEAPPLTTQAEENAHMAEIELITGEPCPHLTLGPRLEGEIRRRVRELEARAKGALTSAERRELNRLLELLRLAQDGGQDHG
jgi:hypothetical protein